MADALVEKKREALRKIFGNKETENATAAEIKKMDEWKPSWGNPGGRLVGDLRKSMGLKPLSKVKTKGKSGKKRQTNSTNNATTTRAATTSGNAVDMKTAVAFAIKSFGSIETAIAQLEALVGIDAAAYVDSLKEYQSVAAIAQPDIKALAKEIVTDLKALGVKKGQINAAKIRADHKWNVGSIDDAELSEIVAEVFSA